MKKKEPRFIALYAAPGFFNRKNGEEQKPDIIPPVEADKPSGNEYPENYMEDDGPTVPPMVCVYAGPDWFKARAEEREADMKEVYACPDISEPEEQPEEKPEEQPGDGLSEEERSIIEKLKNDPPAMMGLVQAPPDLMGKFPADMGMMKCGGDEHARFCAECGAKAVEGDKYCRCCGNKLV
ncbi:MAG: hypothetical protein IJM18_07780 [Clostridia bacterium]|nr:hypothetical protein [Clostridia bacterium]